MAIAEVPRDTVLVRSRQYSQAAVLGVPVDERYPAGDDELIVARRAEVAGILMPRHEALIPTGHFRPNAVNGRSDDLGANDGLDPADDRPRCDELVKSRTAVSTSSPAGYR